jgi:hypothetical protein
MMCPHSAVITNESEIEDESLPKSLVDYSTIIKVSEFTFVVQSSWRSESDSGLSLVHDEGNSNIGQTAIRGNAKENKAQIVDAIGVS